MEQGTVKWFNNSKGYGFLVSADKSKDVFIHYSSIAMEGYKTLKTGQTVLFEATSGPKGLHATALAISEQENKPAFTKLDIAQ